MTKKNEVSFYERYPPSPPCGCSVCASYCLRPGWWTVEQACLAVSAGLAFRMMLELAPDCSFGVLAPAFKGCEGHFALAEYSKNGCCFLKDGMCELHGTLIQPLECRFCHHSRQGMGQKCHEDIGKRWNSTAGHLLVERWLDLTGLTDWYGL